MGQSLQNKKIVFVTVLMFVCLGLAKKVENLVRTLAQICLCHFSGKVWANPLLEVDLCEQMHLSSIALWTKALFSDKKYLSKNLLST